MWDECRVGLRGPLTHDLTESEAFELVREWRRSVGSRALEDGNGLKPKTVKALQKFYEFMETVGSGKSAGSHPHGSASGWNAFKAMVAREEARAGEQDEEVDGEEDEDGDKENDTSRPLGGGNGTNASSLVLQDHAQRGGAVSLGSGGNDAAKLSSHPVSHVADLGANLLKRFETFYRATNALATHDNNHEELKAVCILLLR